MRVQAVPTTKLQITVDVVTDRLIGEIAELGVHGVNKSEVASSIIRMWLWENQGRLRDSGVQFRITRGN